MSDAPTVTVKIHEEVCCSRCESVVHTHFDCPNCNDSRTVYPGTSVHATISEGRSFTCQDCGTKYRCTDRSSRADEITVREMPPLGER